MQWKGRLQGSPNQAAQVKIEEHPPAPPPHQETPAQIRPPRLTGEIAQSTAEPTPVPVLPAQKLTKRNSLGGGATQPPETAQAPLRPRAAALGESTLPKLLRARANALGESSLPAPVLDRLPSVAKSGTQDRLTSESVKPALPDSSTQGFLRAYLSANRDRNAQNLVSAYLEEAQKTIPPPGDGRRKQLQKMAGMLGGFKALGQPQPIKDGLAMEKQLLQDTLADPVIMNSVYVSSPAHATELKRLGLQPTVAARVGQFTDDKLEDPMTRLGSGALNTVYRGEYALPGRFETYKGVFKPEVSEWRNIPRAGIDSGIDPESPRAGYRNIATTRLDELLNLGRLTTQSEMALHDGLLGTVSRQADGRSPKGPLRTPNVPMDDEKVKRVRGGLTQENWLEIVNRNLQEGNPPGAPIVEKMGSDGKQRYYKEAESVRNINYADPLLRRELVRLQLMDSIAGQVDRHLGNYFVNQDANGACFGVMGIDHDLSWGKLLTKVEQNTSPAYHLPAYLPPVVDRAAFDAIMSINPRMLKAKLGGLLTTDELDAAISRLELVQAHLSGLKEDAILTELDQWSQPATTERLLALKDGKHTNYVARDMGILEDKRSQGLVIDFAE